MTRKFFIVIIFIFSFSPITLAQVTNEREASEFLKFYCLELVKNIEGSYFEQVEAVKLNNWETFLEKGRWIGAIADVYSKLCK